MKRLWIAAVAFALFLTGCTTGSYVTKNSTEIDTPTQMSMSYELFTGHKEKKITVREGEPLTVAVDFVTKSGELDVYIAKDNDKANSAYEGNNVETSSFTVTLSEPGTYTIRVDAEHHVGLYSFTWSAATIAG